MDGDISKIGEQFDSYGDPVVYNDWDDMATSLFPFHDGTAGSSVPTTSTTGAGQQYSLPHSPSHMMASSYAQHGTPGHGQLSYAAVARRGIQQSISVPFRATVPAPMQGSAPQEMQSQIPRQPDYNLRQERYQQYMSSLRPQTYAQALRSPQTIEPALPRNEHPAMPLHVGQDFWEGQPSDAGQDRQYPNPSGYAFPFQALTQTGGLETAPCVGAPAQFSQNDVSTNVNWQPGITERFGTVRDWAEQPRATGHRERPSINSHLSPERDEATYLSPLPASSPASSSRFSGRRSRDQRQSGTYEYRCNTCGDGFDTTTDLNHHFRSHTPYEQRPNACDICGRRFMYAKDLRRHQTLHDPYAPKHLCPFTRCKFAIIGFKREDHLERHLRTHAVDSAQQPSRPASLQG